MDYIRSSRLKARSIRHVILIKLLLEIRVNHAIMAQLKINSLRGFVYYFKCAMFLLGLYRD